MIKSFIVSLYNLIIFCSIKKEKKEFVFFSESRYYRNYYKDLITNLKIKKQKNIVLITQDIEDINYFKDSIDCYLIKNYFLLSILFKVISCKFFILTLTDIGNHLQKSKNCKFYVYYFHALSSTHKIYTATAFNNYDIIFTNGEYQKKELEFCESNFSFAKKEIINTGYFYLDYLSRKGNFSAYENNYIFFAPSWNYNNENLFDKYAIQIIRILIDKNFKLILRPHPEHYKRSKKTILKIDKLYGQNNNFILDKNTSNLESLENASLVLTDNSSIVFEFLLIFKRPVIYINYREKIHNVNLKKIPIISLEEKFKKLFGKELDIHEIKKLGNECKKLIKDKPFSEERIVSFINDNLSNFGNSSNFAADYLIKKSSSIL